MGIAPIKGFDASNYNRGMSEILGHTNKDYKNLSRRASLQVQDKSYLDVPAAKKFFADSIRAIKGFFASKAVK